MRKLSRNSSPGEAFVTTIAADFASWLLLFQLVQQHGRTGALSEARAKLSLRPTRFRAKMLRRVVRRLAAGGHSRGDL